MQSRRLAFALLLALFATLPAAAQKLPCAPCAGVRVADAATAAGLAASLTEAAGRVGAELSADEAPFVVAWSVAATADADTAASARAADAVRAAGATPWVTLVLAAPAPLLENQQALDSEIAAASRLARATGAAWYQLDWQPPGGPPADADAWGSEYAYLLKRASVALSGAQAEARVVSAALRGPVGSERPRLEALYSHEVAGYLEAVAVASLGEAQVSAAGGAVDELDPGRPLVLDAVPFPPVPERALPLAASYTVAGAGLVLFDASRDPAPPDATALAPLALMAREMAGDLSHDPTSSPGRAGWTFVRGSDLGLRVIAPVPRQGATKYIEELVLDFPDTQLKDPQRVLLTDGEAIPLAGARRTAGGLQVRVADPGPSVLLRLARVGVEELGEIAGLEEEVTVASERTVPVEEILRRLQAFEDAQARRIDHYAATNSTALRFGVGAGSTGSFEATFEGPFFFDPETGIDWAWEQLYVNGVRWRGKSIPEIPLVQPERAAAVPGDITFDKTYRYRLRGTDTVDGRDCWVVEFEPAVAVGEAAADGDGEEAVSLYRGTVWIDREVFARVRTRAVQLGLTGDVLSNEETLHYSPIDDAGADLAWGADGAYVLPLRIVAQQLLSVLNGTTLVERETRFTGVTINGESFAERRAAVMSSDVTMVRDTERGLRYLVKDEDSGERVVKEGYDTDKWFLVGGAFWDDSLDYPLPLGGINYLDLDFRDSGSQLNVFFAGALLTANLAQPRLFGSRFDFGGDLFALAVPLGDAVYRDGEEIVDEEVEVHTASASLKIGHPLGSFGKLSGEYRVRWQGYGSADDTGDDFAVPSDHFEHAFGLSTTFARGGWSLTGRLGYSLRSEWEAWGRPGNPGFSPDHEDFLYWRATLGKNWYLGNFQKIGAELVYVDGSDLDRFSKYDFGFFGDTRVHGYRSGRVRAESAYVVHTSYGFEIGELLRLDAQADAAWATDEASGLDNELLAGVGVAGTFLGPWQTIVNLDVGVPVEGPDDGVVAYVVFLKLFR